MILISCRLKLAFSTPKLEYAKHFILKLHFKTDGYYESSTFALLNRSVQVSVCGNAGLIIKIEQVDCSGRG